MSSLCMEVEHLLVSGRIEDAIARLTKQSLPQNELWALIVREVSSRKRFDRAARLIELISQDTVDANQLSQLVQYALYQGQYSFAIKWSRALPVGIRPNVSDCVRVAIEKDSIDVALKSISEMNLEGFDVKSLIEKLCKQENFTAARKYSQKFNLEKEFPPEMFYEMMLGVGQWENALNFRNQIPKLKEEYTGISFLERIIDAKDWVSAIQYAEIFGISARGSSREQLSDEKRTIIRSMIAGMIRDRKLFQAMMLTVAHQFQAEFPPKQLITTMIKDGEYAHALRFIKELQLTDDFQNDVHRINKERLRDLENFRRLINQRSREAKARRPPTTQPMVVVANIFLGARTIQKRPDGKLVVLSALGDVVHALVKDEVVVSSKSHSQKGNADEDDDDEEILVPQKKPSSANAQPPPAPRSSSNQRQSTGNLSALPVAIASTPQDAIPHLLRPTAAQLHPSSMAHPPLNPIPAGVPLMAPQPIGPFPHGGFPARPIMMPPPPPPPGGAYPVPFSGPFNPPPMMVGGMPPPPPPPMSFLGPPPHPGFQPAFVPLAPPTGQLGSSQPRVSHETSGATDRVVTILKRPTQPLSTVPQQQEGGNPIKPQQEKKPSTGPKKMIKPTKLV